MARLNSGGVFLAVVLIGSTLILVLMTVRGRYITKRLIRYASFRESMPRNERTLCRTHLTKPPSWTL